MANYIAAQQPTLRRTHFGTLRARRLFRSIELGLTRPDRDSPSQNI